MLTIATVNTAHVASGAGLSEWLRAPETDVMCLQSTGAQEERIRQTAREQGWHPVFATPARQGGSGVAILSRAEPETSRVGFDSGKFDDAGRYVEVELRDVVVGSVHLPLSVLDDAAVEERARFLQAFSTYLVELRSRAEAESQEVLICGAGNLLEPGDEPDEASESLEQQRVQLGRAFTEAGYVDVVGTAGLPGADAAEDDPARFPNYHVATEGLAGRVISAWTTPPHAEAAGWTEGALVTVQYDL